MRVRRLALLALLTLMAPAMQAWPSGGLPVEAVTPHISLLSTSQWVETIDAATNLRSYHLVGEVRNDTGANATAVQLNLNLFDNLGNPAGHTSTETTIEILGPGERSPFEAILFPSPPNYASFAVAQPIPFAASVQRPDHNFVTSVDACLNPVPSSPDCQDHLSGSAQNPSSAPTVHQVAAIFSFYDASGTIVGQNRTDVTNAGGQTDLAPGETGHFTLDRTGEPSWSSRALVVEPQYPIDVNPPSLNFGNQRVGRSNAGEDVTFTNYSDNPVTILGAVASGDFSLAALSCTTILPSSSCRAHVGFTPATMGPRTGNLTVTENAAGSPNVIPLAGVGVAPIVALDHTSLDLGSQAVDTTSPPRTLTLTNVGTDTLTISAIDVTGDFSTSQCPATIGPSGSCLISLTFSPQTGGPRNGTLTITDDAAGSPRAVSLTGIGLGPGVAVTPISLDFGAVSVGSASDVKTIQLKNSGSAALAITDISSTGDFTVTDGCPRSPATLAGSATCTISVTFTPGAPGARSGTLTIVDNAGDSPQVYALRGLGAQTTYTTSITSQARLSNSDGVSWQPVDPGLTLTIKPTESATVLLSGNADLWTATAGVNQDLGIVVSVGGGTDTLLFWKESGGFAGTLSPNAAFVHGSYRVASGFTYVFKLVWKANHATGASIFAGAGPIGVAYSPTRLTAQLVTTGVAGAAITSQPTLVGSDGISWTELDPSLAVQFSGSLGTSAVIAGNADLWTATSGINQDLGIFVTPPGQQPQLVAWKESGGSAGTFSPNAAYVQAVISTPSPGIYRVNLRWKMNVNAPRATIVAGAGPINDRYSPTTLTVQLLNASAVVNPLTTRQSTLSGSNGIEWSPLGSLSFNRSSSTSNAVAVVGANADLWTNTRGINQDLGIFLSIDGAADVLVGWKESGGFAGVFSPNAAFAQAVVLMPSGHRYTLTLKWKTNRPEGSATIAAGAGPIGTAYSPTSLMVQISPD